ncbi:MAG: glycosyltransferase [Bacteroidetes bacterium]|jgi:glycosyltransferase involved in cell wall biosynthesis|nr:glycosyltransferase [Bacteroidota bacterium]MBK9542252.1 glycosyltransferase [Bacteroidota bacterium]MBP6402852.1 glycosyltransferase [Bacteroidia bacterium]MBP6648698.1 glycosyltransferase [Bacteroidia bacterium]
MDFSIIIPSFNQEKFIGSTMENVTQLKKLAAKKNISVEILLIDSESNTAVQEQISKYRSDLDYVDTRKDKGQYDAINKGLEVCKGTYWTWLNTDDHIDLDGFFKLAEMLKSDSTIDYIYGGIHYMDTNDKVLSLVKAKQLTLKELVNKTPGIYQPGSFFKKSFTDKIGFLKPYRCCFDYEYILRCLSFNAKFVCCEFPVSRFRYYSDSKTGSLIPIFIREQLDISSDYGRSYFSFLTWFSHLRLLKHKLFQR